MEEEYEEPELKPMFANSTNARIASIFAAEVAVAAVAVLLYVAVTVSTMITNNPAE